MDLVIGLVVAAVVLALESHNFCQVLARFLVRTWVRLSNKRSIVSSCAIKTISFSKDNSAVG
jgi:hypothetical protein